MKVIRYTHCNAVNARSPSASLDFEAYESQIKSASEPSL